MTREFHSSLLLTFHERSLLCAFSSQQCVEPWCRVKVIYVLYHTLLTPTCMYTNHGKSSAHTKNISITCQIFLSLMSTGQWDVRVRHWRSYHQHWTKDFWSDKCDWCEVSEVVLLNLEIYQKFDPTMSWQSGALTVWLINESHRSQVSSLYPSGTAESMWGNDCNCWCMQNCLRDSSNSAFQRFQEDQHQWLTKNWWCACLSVCLQNKSACFFPNFLKVTKSRGQVSLNTTMLM